VEVAQIPALCLLVLLNTSRDMRSGPGFTLPEESAAETRHLRQTVLDWCVSRLRREVACCRRAYLVRAETHGAGRRARASRSSSWRNTTTRSCCATSARATPIG
jgi:hypothetical protein